MKKIVIIDDEDDILNILTIIIQAEFKNPILTAKTGNSGITLIAEHMDDIELIISDYNMPNGDGSDVFKYNEQHHNIPFFLITGGFVEDYSDVDNILIHNKLNAIITKPIDENNLISLMNNIIRPSNNIKKLKQIDINYLAANHKYSTPYGLFLKIDQKYIKFKNNNDQIDLTKIKQYQSRGEIYIYMNNEEANDFFKNIEDMNCNTIDNSLVLKERTLLNSGITLEYVTNGYQELGITSFQKETINTMVDNCVNVLLQDNSISNIINIFLKDKGHLISHSINTIHISYMICKKLKIENDENIRKLTFAAILHDIPLSGTNLSVINDITSDDLKNLTGSEKDLILTHPTTLFKQHNLGFSSLPAGVFDIIAEHHEKPNGTGFPKALHHDRISPWGSLFIIALEIADYMYFNNVNTKTAKTFKYQLKEKYNYGNFKDYLNAVDDILSLKNI